MNAHADRPPWGMTVFYDGNCRICRRMASWLREADTYFPVSLIDLHDPEASRSYPEIREELSDVRFVVLTDDGRMYLDTKAKLMVLYATTRYRELSYDLASPLLYSLTDTVFSSVAAGRHLLDSTQSGIGASCEGDSCHGR